MEGRADRTSDPAFVMRGERVATEARTSVRTLTSGDHIRQYHAATPERAQNVKGRNAQRPAPPKAAPSLRGSASRALRRPLTVTLEYTPGSEPWVRITGPGLPTRYWHGNTRLLEVVLWGVWR